ncbi:hypothetical protein NC651_016381 [Populus alba x Populus x berolinensis]|nr:hypothetical protein NC651_016381 [Populus alba x Populus x berolinensis]
MLSLDKDRKSLLDRKVEGRAVGDKEKGTTFTVSFGLPGRGTCCVD